MDVQLYVYDLTRGMAKAMSRQFLGIQIDAVYHTSLVFDNIEYFFGMGVQTCYAGSTHHGQPMEILPMGRTHYPMHTILEYLESLKAVYTPESYDLFAHNCNNFTNDFAMFLVGKGIPDHITGLPRRVLDTPFGQMLKPQIDASMRSVTQAPVPPQNVPSQANRTKGASNMAQEASPDASKAVADNTAPAQAYGQVMQVTNLAILEKHLQSASNTAATIFFTSSTCAPCRLAYSAFDSLAEQNPRALFVKVDINSAHDVASQYRIRATPTFMTFSKGVKQDEWAGADPSLLKANVEKLIRATYPPHPHTLLKVPTLQYGSLKPVTFVKVPPLDKLIVKLGDAGGNTELSALRRFIEMRNVDPKEAALPNMRAISTIFRDKVLNLPAEVRFAAVDLLRCAAIDARVSGFLAEENKMQTASALIGHVNDLSECPHNLRLVTLHLACNLFSSPLFVKEITRSDNDVLARLIQLLTTSLLDTSHPTTRVASASLAFNLATANYRIRREEAREALAEGTQVELAASLIETLSSEENADAAKALLLALGYLLFCGPVDGELVDLCNALDARSTVGASKMHSALAKEVASLL